MILTQKAVVEPKASGRHQFGRALGDEPHPNFFHSFSLVSFRAQSNAPNAARAVSRTSLLALITVSGQERRPSPSEALSAASRLMSVRLGNNGFARLLCRMLLALGRR